MITDKILKDEARIQWLTKNRPPWVREIWGDFNSRTGLSESEFQRCSNGQTVIGYAELSEKAVPKFVEADLEYFERRIFVIRDRDLEDYQGDTFPLESVVPESIEPGVRGVHPGKKAQIGVRLPLDLFFKLNGYAQLTGQSLTDVVIQSLGQFLNQNPVGGMTIEDRVQALERRMQKVEHQLGQG